MAETDPASCTSAGHRPPRLRRRRPARPGPGLARRIGHVHLKDIRPDVMVQCDAARRSFLEAVKAGVFTVPGDGCHRLRPDPAGPGRGRLRGLADRRGRAGPAKANPLEYALKARAYIRATAGI